MQDGFSGSELQPIQKNIIINCTAQVDAPRQGHSPLLGFSPDDFIRQAHLEAVINNKPVNLINFSTLKPENINPKTGVAEPKLETLTILPENAVKFLNESSIKSNIEYLKEELEKEERKSNQDKNQLVIGRLQFLLSLEEEALRKLFPEKDESQTVL